MHVIRNVWLYFTNCELLMWACFCINVFFLTKFLVKQEKLIKENTTLFLQSLAAIFVITEKKYIDAN